MSVAPGPIGSGVPFSSLEPISFTQSGEVCRPRAFVKVDGRLYALKSYTIKKNCHGATNEATFLVSIANNPDWSNQLFRGTGRTGQTDNSPVYIEIWAGFPPNPGSTPTTAGLTRRFYGVLDEWDPDNLSQTEFHCRSIASPLTTDRITTAVQNLTTVDFIKRVCAPYGIKVVIDPSLTNPFTLGQVYAGEYIIGLHNLIKWDVLLRSSWFDDVDVWEDDGTLYYVHPWNVSTVVPTSKTLQLQYGTNVKSFKGNHAPQFSRNIRVVVSSYRAKTRTSVNTRIQSVVGNLSGVSVTQVVKTSIASPQWGTNAGTTTTYYNDGTTTVSRWTGSGGSSSGSNAPIGDSGLEMYRFPVPNLSSPQCQALALAIWRQISQHEYSGEIILSVTPENLQYLNIESRFNLDGYVMAFFNTLYWPRSFDEEFEMAEENSGNAGGWTVTLNVINHTPPLGGV
jgi:hypothetical protein